MKTPKIMCLLSILVIILTANVQFSCNGFNNRQEVVDSLFLYTDEANSHYDLKNPSEKYDLPYVLSEVSGLSYKDPGLLFMIEDEMGKVYVFDLDSRKVIRSVQFNTPGDYEAVEMVEDQIFVLKSSGTTYRFSFSDSSVVRPLVAETVFSSDNDMEGLAYDKRNKKLIFSTKEEGGIEGQDVDGNAIFALDPDGLDQAPELILSITNEDLKEFFEAKKEQEYKANKFKFEPSAVAVHPHDGSYYLLASVGKLLLVFDRQGTLRTSYPILPRILNQPEGICFAPNGDMYISSEGEGDRGFVLKFPMMKK